MVNEENIHRFGFLMGGLLHESQYADYFNPNLKVEIKYLVNELKNNFENYQKISEIIPEYGLWGLTNDSKIYTIKDDTCLSISVLFKSNISLAEFVSIFLNKKQTDLIVEINDIVKNISNLPTTINKLGWSQSDTTNADYFHGWVIFFRRLVFMANFIGIKKNFFLNIINFLFDMIFFEQNKILENYFDSVHLLWPFLQFANLENDTKELILTKIGYYKLSVTPENLENWSFDNIYIEKQPYNYFHTFLYTMEGIASKFNYPDFYNFFLDVIAAYIYQTYYQKSLRRLFDLSLQVPNSSNLQYNDKKIEQILKPLPINPEKSIELSSLFCIVYEKYSKYTSERKSYIPFVRNGYERTIKNIDQKLNLKSFKIKGFPVFQQYTGSCWLAAMFKIDSYWSDYKPTIKKFDEQKSWLKDNTDLAIRLEDEEELKNFINRLHASPEIKGNLMDTWLKGEGGNVNDWLLQPVDMPSITPETIYEALRTYGPLYVGGDYADYAKKTKDEKTSHAVCVIGIIHSWLVIISDSNDYSYVERVFPFDSFLERLHKKGTRYTGGYTLIHPFWYHRKALRRYNEYDGRV